MHKILIEPTVTMCMQAPLVKLDKVGLDITIYGTKSSHRHQSQRVIKLYHPYPRV